MVVKRFESSRKSEVTVPQHAARPVDRGLGMYVIGLAMLAVLIPLHGLWAVQLLLVPLLLAVPGAILLRALRIPSRNVYLFPVYVPCASVVVLMGSGLAVDLIGPWIGVRAPLRPWPLLIGLVVTCLVLLTTSVNASENVIISPRLLPRPTRIAWPFILPLAAAAGAIRLNNGHSNSVAVLALCACLITVLLVFLLYSRFDNMQLAVVLYAVGLAMMWSFSLRGNLVYGFDISAEYYDLQQAVVTGVWHAAHPGDAYGAMLSVTVMPAELHFLSGVPALLIFKVIYPAIGALFPVAIFSFARRVLARRWAFAAAAFTATQATFFQQIPGLARQEIAIVLFAGLVATMLDTRIRRRSQWALAALLAASMALSHYSTTYLAVTVIGIMIALQWAASWLRDIPRVTGAVVVSFAIALLGAIIWYGPVTHSTSVLGQFVHTTQAQGLDVLPNRVPGENMISAYLQANSETPISAVEYSKLISSFYASHDRYITPLPDAGNAQYELRNATPPTPKVKWHAGYNALSLGWGIVQQLANVLGAIGALLIVLRRKTSFIARQIGLLALASLAFLVTIKFSGTLAMAYNWERAQLQAFVVLAITLCWSLEQLAGSRRRLQAAVVTFMSVWLAVMFINTSGLIGTALGGATPTNLANSGEDFERFDMTAPELASARWLGEQIHPGQLLYADRYAQLRLLTAIGLTHGIFGDVTPLTLNQYAWVYASRTNVIDNLAATVYDDHSVTYIFPISFLDTNYNLVYTDGSSEVFYR